jgi:hypothetical protein
MKRVAVALPVALAILASCTGTQAPPHDARFEGEGLIRGTLLLGDQELQDGWVEMVVWRASEDQCRFPNDCGLSVDALRSGQYWDPGRWIVVPPPVKGWVEPLPFDIVVRANRLTTFEAKYRRAAKSDPGWEEGLFGRQEADFPIGLGFVFENIWRQVIDGEYIAVYAGSHADPDSFEASSDGAVLVTVIDPETWGHKYSLVEAPIPGPIRIMSVNGHRLTMVAPSGERAVYDADARQFV